MATSVPGITAGVGAASKAEADHEKATQRVTSELNKSADLMRKKNEIMEGDLRNRSVRDSAQQAKKEKEEESAAAAAAAKEMRGLASVVTVAASAFFAVNRVLSTMQAGRESGSKDVSKIREDLASSLAGLGYSKGDQDKMIKRGESAEGLGPYLTQEKRAAIYRAAEGARIGANLPGTDMWRKNLEGIESSVGAGKMTFEQGLAAAGQPFAFAPQLKTMGFKGVGRSGSEAIAFDTDIAQKNLASQVGQFEKGRIEQRSTASLANQGREDIVGAASQTLDNPIGRGLGRATVDVFQNAGKSENGMDSIINYFSRMVRGIESTEKNTSPPPPSTNPTR